MFDIFNSFIFKWTAVLGIIAVLFMCTRKYLEVLGVIENFELYEKAIRCVTGFSGKGGVL